LKRSVVQTAASIDFYDRFGAAFDISSAFSYVQIGCIRLRWRFRSAIIYAQSAVADEPQNFAQEIT
jgi:hypothetical protein